MDPVSAEATLSDDEVGTGVDAGVEAGVDMDLVVRSSASLSSSSSTSMPSSRSSSSTEPELCLSLSLDAVPFPLPLAPPSLESGVQSNLCLLFSLLSSEDGDDVLFPAMISAGGSSSGAAKEDLFESVGVPGGIGRGVDELDRMLLLNLSDLSLGEGSVVGAKPMPGSFLGSGLVGPPANCFRRCE